MTTGAWKKTVLKFTLIAIVFSWPFMFLVDAWLVYKYSALGNLKMALLVLLAGHSIAMLGPAIAGFIVQFTDVKKPFPKWQWGRVKHYLYVVLFFFTAWLIPAIVGIIMGKFNLQLGLESHYKLYMVIYIFLVPFAGLGEELGWCSFLLTYLKPYIGKFRAVVVSGMIRGLWHLPVLLGPHIYKYIKGTESLTTVLIMTLVLSLQLMISNIFFGAAFNWIWFKTKSSPLLGWSHFVVDLARDFITIVVVGYASSNIAMLAAQLPLILMGAYYLEKLKKEEGIKGLKAYFK
ncbi:CPBP family intramembrane metalloprotease [Clostridium sp. 'deep sea']|uniref:CPBP family intramembrane glutamic endopeptidase n=1 Tax=Clostridium sp. 'deep sea' TaxID=2779445 RepID=UPI00189648C0|nr:CPBP family intramembrane glutamic endopeptidase [Clostridium sp. 'deep sea']QOR35448.1 CPBP family intramembrane metalloprotease [Clostridium sp. 'deep sea']